MMEKRKVKRKKREQVFIARAKGRYGRIRGMRTAQRTYQLSKEGQIAETKGDQCIGHIRGVA